MNNTGRINNKGVREYILNRIKVARPGWECTQVSPKVFYQLDIKLRAILDRAVHQHPSKGKTFREML